MLSLYVHLCIYKCVCVCVRVCVSVHFVQENSWGKSCSYSLVCICCLLCLIQLNCTATVCYRYFTLFSFNTRLFLFVFVRTRRPRNCVAVNYDFFARHTHHFFSRRVKLNARCYNEAD